MKVTVIGLGYLGATHAVAMAELGHEVIGIEPDPRKLSALSQGVLPFHEPGLDTALTKTLATGKLTFKAAHDAESAASEIFFICVGTPQRAGSDAADTSYVISAAEDLARWVGRDAVVAGKSTVPVGTAAELKKRMDAIAGFDVHLAWNPEFLREGTALEDSLRPDRIVVGTFDQHSVQVIKNVYAPILESGTPFLELDVPTAELVKVAANAFLATKISFINAMAEVAEVSGADAVALAKAIGYDERIGNKFLRTGIGFGGGCLPKDIRGFMARADELGVGSAVEFLRNVDQVNLRRRDRVVSLANTELGEVSGKAITMLGISFKPDSDDLRDSPALEIAQRLQAQGAHLTVHDPVSLVPLASRAPELSSEQDLMAAVKSADLVILGTEWKQYREVDPAELGELVKTKTVIDGRNVLDVARWQQAGWKVIALGRNIQNG
ncbi:UDP-glucose/GDP-mannose dehydrogenase family protein [Aquiluna borgnonia]|uniref:UDP-glucose 6-dehydrogenase n=1 Tax=Aquiluna borgnonia TaxID=2499157 RepID=A0A7D4TID8_9MICO|nr:UDP-glucose/GDP-mannose dehydrogenase family protein [Aquiluna borgnonia]QKJ24751.1 UDP-glucose/GDP-mannose dehydrogenase family protein [Aquiluna borgnonia]